MERTRYFLIVLFSIAIFSVFGQSKEEFYNAYISGDMTKWKTALDLLENVPDKTNSAKLDLVNYQYGYIAYCLEKKNKSEAEKYLEKAEKAVSELEKKSYKSSMLNAYKAAFVGFRIALSPYKAPFIGHKSEKFAKKSVEIDPTNELGYEQLGNIYFHKPAMFGGSVEEAIKYYLKSYNLMKSDKKAIENNWNYLNSIANLIHSYYELGKYQQAKDYCIEALEVEPEFLWVKNELYPKILKKLNNE